MVQSPLSLGRPFASLIPGRQQQQAAPRALDSSFAAAGCSVAGAHAAAAAAAVGSVPTSHPAVPLKVVLADLPPMGDIKSIAEVNLFSIFFVTEYLSPSF